ncbi:MAG TPA: PH domain-containing protein [Candidatus Dormibacteraeota bacterium]|nr:PH domain-containing protein [Candidatus Dormibacteraeota bacterium]
MALELHPGERVIYEGHPSWRSTIAFYLKGLLIAIVVGVICWLIDSIGLGAGAAVVVFAVVIVVGFIRRYFTVFTITNQRLRIQRGIVSRHVQQTQIERVQNVNTNQGIIQRMLMVGTVDFDTAGTGDADFAFHGVNHPEKVVAAVDKAHADRGTAAPGDQSGLGERL